MAWFKFDHSLPEKPEVLEIARRLGIPRAHVVGALCLVWRWFSEQTVTGSSRDCHADVQDVSGLPGFGEAMEAVGWLVREGGVMRVPGFERWLGSAKDARRQHEKRNRDRGKAMSRDNHVTVTHSSVTITPQTQTQTQTQTPSSLRSEGRAVAIAPAVPRKARKEPAGPQAETIRLWERLYLESRGIVWVWNAKHAAHIATCRKHAAEDQGELERRMRMLLFEPPSDWYAQNATPAILASHWNELAQRVVVDRAEQKQADKIAKLERIAHGPKPLNGIEREALAALCAPSDRAPGLGVDGVSAPALGARDRGRAG